MKLIKARVENFKSIEDSGEFKVESEEGGNITCFVGKNEAGKTSLLKALHQLNPFSGKRAFNKEQDYPRRHLTEYEERHGTKPANVVTATFQLDDDELTDIERALGKGALKSTQVEVEVGYGPKMLWTVLVNEAVVVTHLLSESELFEEEKQAFGTPKLVSDLLAKAKIAAAAEGASAGMKAFPAEVEKACPQGEAWRGVYQLIDLPSFMFVSSYQRMRGAVSIDKLTQLKAEGRLDADDEVFLALCELAGTSLEEAAAINTFEGIISKFEGASTRISKEIFNYWSQNKHLKVQVRMDVGHPGDPAPFNSGKVVRTRVFNSLHDVTVSFDDRSTGFVWFFSFIALFSQIKKKHQGDLIILLDEPGLSLHGTAQADLLRYFKEKLAPHHQVLYTTHSPFMVPTDNVLACRTVEDVVKEHEVIGTRVGSDVLSTDKETLFPLQGALGYHISQSLFVGEHTLIVEGPSDILYIHAISQILKEEKRVSLDPRWTLSPAGGIDKVPPFVSLFGGSNKLHIAVLTDIAKGQKKAIERVRDLEILRTNHLFTADMFAEQDEADTEDMLGEELYLWLVGQAFGLTKAQHVPKRKDGQGRVLKHAEEHFRTLPAKVADFSHYGPAEFLVTNRQKVIDEGPGLDVALDRFETFFKAVNALL